MTELSLLNVEISEHAIEKYIERCKINDIPMSHKHDIVIEAEVKSILIDAEYEEVDKRQRVHRLIKNRFQPAEYYTIDGWRFVISNNVVVTIERCNPLENIRGAQ